ncbi:Atu4866 domain-containing protein [Streptomyces prasinus]
MNPVPSGDRVDYLDDLGFRAVGYFRGDELHHVGYVMRLD